MYSTNLISEAHSFSQQLVCGSITSVLQPKLISWFFTWNRSAALIAEQYQLHFASFLQSFSALSVNPGSRGEIQCGFFIPIGLPVHNIIYCSLWPPLFPWLLVFIADYKHAHLNQFLFSLKLCLLHVRFPICLSVLPTSYWRPREWWVLFCMKTGLLVRWDSSIKTFISSFIFRWKQKWSTSSGRDLMR